MAAAKSGKSSVRREALLDAAAEVFFEQGYSATSIDAIIERAGGSKRNIYNEFGNKEGLFAALVTGFAEKALSSLVIDQNEDHDLREMLHSFGRHLMAVYMAPGPIRLYRTIIAEANRYPDLGRTFYELGAARATARLAEVLEAARAKGEIQADDCARIADHFVGMIRGNLHLQVVLGVRPPPSEQEADDAVLSAVDLVLAALTPR
jgi:AcrR family transcriptional regulator